MTWAEARKYIRNNRIMIERAVVEEALHASSGNITKAALVAQMDRANFYRLMRSVERSKLNQKGDTHEKAPRQNDQVSEV